MPDEPSSLEISVEPSKKLEELISRWKDTLSGLLESDVQATLTLDEIASYFQEHRPESLDGAGGALVVIRTVGFRTLIQLFIDHLNQPITDRKGKLLGRVIKFRDYDAQLAELVGDSEVVILR